MEDTNVAAEIVAQNGVNARNALPKITNVLVLAEVDRLERAGKNRTIVLDAVASRFRALGASPTKAAEPLLAEQRERIAASPEAREIARILDPKPTLEDGVLVDASPAHPDADPSVGLEAADGPEIVCTRCRETRARGEQEIEAKFGHRNVPSARGPVRKHQPQCRTCRNLPPARRTP